MGSIKITEPGTVEVTFSKQEVVDALVAAGQRAIIDSEFLGFPQQTGDRASEVVLTFSVDADKNTPQLIAERKEVRSLKSRFDRNISNHLPTKYRYEGYEKTDKGYSLKYRGHHGDRDRYVQFLHDDDAGWRHLMMHEAYKGW